ncbi:MAG: Obg family GTPase CgtA, partial [Janibacter sp.]
EMVKADLEERGLEVHIVSAVAHLGLKELTFALSRHVTAARAEDAADEAAPQRTILRPKAVDDSGFVVRRETTPDGEAFRVIGQKVTRWVHQTDFANDEAIGYLSDRLARAGVEDALTKAGAVAGSTVLIGPEDDSVVFDWEPTLIGGAELLGGRGSDLRLEEQTRRTTQERRDDFHARKDAQTAAREDLREEREAGHWVEDD